MDYFLATLIILMGSLVLDGGPSWLVARIGINSLPSRVILNLWPIVLISLALIGFYFIHDYPFYPSGIVIAIFTPILLLIRPFPYRLFAALEIAYESDPQFCGPDNSEKREKIRPLVHYLQHERVAMDRLVVILSLVFWIVFLLDHPIYLFVYIVTIISVFVFLRISVLQNINNRWSPEVRVFVSPLFNA